MPHSLPSLAHRSHRRHPRAFQGLREQYGEYADASMWEERIMSKLCDSIRGRTLYSRKLETISDLFYAVDTHMSGEVHTETFAAALRHLRGHGSSSDQAWEGRLTNTDIEYLVGLIDDDGDGVIGIEELTVRVQAFDQKLKRHACATKIQAVQRGNMSRQVAAAERLARGEVVRQQVCSGPKTTPPPKSTRAVRATACVGDKPPGAVHLSAHHVRVHASAGALAPAPAFAPAPCPAVVAVPRCALKRSSRRRRTGRRR